MVRLTVNMNISKNLHAVGGVCMGGGIGGTNLNASRQGDSNGSIIILQYFTIIMYKKPAVALVIMYVMFIYHYSN